MSDVAFVRSVRDCATRAADHVRSLTGCDPMSDLRGAYDSLESAARVLRAEGGFAAAIDRRVSPWGRVAEAHAEIALLQLAPEAVLAVRAGDWWETIGMSGAISLIKVGACHPIACWGPSDGR